MAVDYDLVILGGGLEGRIAAMTAVGYGARVALVEPPGLFDDGQQQRFLLLGLQQLARVRQGQSVGEWFGYGQAAVGLNWSALVKWSWIAAESQCARLSAAALSASGVDVVLERPERLSRRRVVTTQNRQLSARGVLAAYGSVPSAMSLLEATSMPEVVGVEGGSAIALAWAEALAVVGVRVRLIAERFLPGADEDIRRLVRSQLVSAGVELASASEGDRFTLKIDPSEPALTLPAFVSKHSNKSPYLSVNRKLQTNQKRLFACGSVLGSPINMRLAEYEAKLAVKNALFLPRQKVDYRTVVRGYGRCAFVGLTQAEAVRQYGDVVRVQAVSDANGADLSRVTPMPLYCKLVLVGDRLMGIHLLGEGAKGQASLLSARLGQSIFDFEERSSGEQLVDLFFECVRRSQQHRWQEGRWRRDWAENWFNWRRSRR